MRFNAPGEMVAAVCCETPHSVPNMNWGIYQIMPNHFHAIIELNCDGGATLPTPHVGATLPIPHVGADLP